MNLLSRYIALNVMMGIVAAAALLLPLFGFFDLIDELDDVGKGNYGMTQALQVAALQLPRRAVALAPFLALLGGIVGLGQLSANSEITAARAAGVPVTGVGMAALSAGLALALTLAAADQWLASPLEQSALNLRAQSVNSDQNSISDNVLWARKDRRMVRVGELRGGRIPADIEIFNLGNDRQLLVYIHAEYATVQGDDTWQLNGVNIKRWGQSGISFEERPQMTWNSIISDRRLDELVLPAASLSPTQLHRHVEFLRAAGQSATPYAVTLWQKAGMPILTAAMILLAVPFAIGHSRGGGLGGKLALGAVTGLAVFLINRLAGAVGIMFSISPPLVGILPGLLMLVLALFLLRRLDRVG